MRAKRKNNALDGFCAPYTVAKSRIPTSEDTHFDGVRGIKYQYPLGTIWLNMAGSGSLDRMFILDELCTEGDSLRASWKAMLKEEVA